MAAGKTQLPEQLRGQILETETFDLILLDVYMPHAFSRTADIVTVSLGVATGIPEENSSPAVLMKEADTALYNAKNDGRNSIPRHR